MKVVVTKRAILDIVQAQDYIALDSKSRARDWSRGLKAELASLGTYPRRHPVDDVLSGLDREIRSFPYHSHRVVYAVTGQAIFVLRVYHAARLPLRPEDLPLEPEE